MTLRWLARLLLVTTIGFCHDSWAQTDKLAADIGETVIAIPVLAEGKPTGGYMVGTLYKPNGDGPFPFVILNHGRATSAVERAKVQRWRYVEQSRWLVRRGFVVIVPTRRGYGGTGGADVENSYACSNPWYRESLAGGVESVLSAIEYAKGLPFANPKRFIVMGQSVGGYVAVGIAAANPEGLAAAISLAGGQGGAPDSHPGIPCAPDKLTRVFAEAGKTARVPMLWIYTENDQYFNPEISRAFHKAFAESGGNAEYKLLPPFGNDGHTLFVRGGEIWQQVVGEFLDKLGL